ncbi:MAG: hypothetical protein HQK65_08825 [Desulfamplus sp.]|nr:hypothetical protein [Desulfamplus sp.]
MKKAITIVTTIFIMFCGLNMSIASGFEMEIGQEYLPVSDHSADEGLVEDAENYTDMNDIYIDNSGDDYEYEDGGFIQFVPCITMELTPDQSDLILHVPCFQYENEIFMTKMHLVPDPYNRPKGVPVWKVELPNLYHFTFDQNDSFMEYTFEIDQANEQSLCLNHDGQLEKDGVLTVECALLLGDTLVVKFDLIKLNHPDDSEGLYLEADLESQEVVSF